MDTKLNIRCCYMKLLVLKFYNDTQERDENCREKFLQVSVTCLARISFILRQSENVHGRNADNNFFSPS